MVRHRSREIVIGLSLVMAITLALFYFIDDPSEMEFTGYAISENHPAYEFHESEVITEGIFLEVVVDGNLFFYVFNDETNEWYESKDMVEWELRPDMQDTLAKGFVYLHSYNAEIYYKGKQIEYPYEIE